MSGGMSRQYRKKAVAVKAILWDGSAETLGAILELARASGVAVGMGCPATNCPLRIGTLEGQMLTQVGDYIIRGVKGELYPCKPDIFAATYDEILPGETEAGA